MHSWQSAPRSIALSLLLCSSTLAQTAKSPSAKPPDRKPIAQFVDIAAKAGLTASNTFGGVDTKKYIIEITGTGVDL